VILVLLGLSLPVTNSRSGMLLFAVIAVVLLGALWRQVRGMRGRLLSLAGVILFTAVGVALTLGEVRANLERTEKQMAMAETLNFDGIRFTEGPRTCWAMLQDRPVWGWGYGSFKTMFLVYATDYFRGEDGRIEKRMEFAHNDWLQHLAEFGWAGAALLLAGIWLALRSDDRGRTSSQGGWIGLGALLMAVFAGWDFPLSNPAVLTNAGLLLAIWKQSKFTK
jgi:O-antigen ligase